MIWKSIETAPKDGTTVWIGAQKFIHKSEQIYCEILLARYDSWNREWRTVEKGGYINICLEGGWLPPKYWCEVEWPSYNDLKQLYTEQRQK